MYVTFYQFSKRENSTKRPSGGTVYNVTLKEPSSVLAPVISLVWTGAGSPVQFNYAHIPAYLRYYYVGDWVYANRQWTVQLTADPLASWKTHIGISKKYVLRADDTTNKNRFLMDHLYPADLQQKYKQTAISNLFYANGLENGVYVFGIVSSGNTPGSFGGITYYVCDRTNANLLYMSVYQKAYEVFDPANTSIADFGKALATFGENLVKGMLNPTSFIVSAMWMRLPPIVTSDTPVTIKVGSFTTTAQGYIVLNPAETILDDLAIPDTPLGATDDYWKVVEPYATYTLEYQPFGIIPLAAQDIIRYEYIHPNVTYDAITGLANLRVMVGDDVNHGTGGVCIATRTAMVGIPLSVAGTEYNNSGAIMDFAGVAKSIASEDYIGAATGIMSAVTDMVPQARSSGTTGGFAGLSCVDRISLVKRYHGWADEDPTEKGYPICKSLVLNTLSGYIQCEEGDVEAPATQAELTQIKAYLEGGFFYE